MTTQLKAAIEAAARELNIIYGVGDQFESEIGEIITRHIEPVVSAMQAELERLRNPRPLFQCPKCGGHHFGTVDAMATPLIRECHDEYQKGCKWSGEWPGADKAF